MLRPHFLGCALSLILLPLPTRGESLLVWSKEAELFRDTRRAGVLKRGEIVSGRTQIDAPAWATIERGGQKLTVQRKHLRTSLDVRQYYAKRIRKSESAIQRLDERLTDAATGIEQRQLTLMQLGRDSVIAFRLPVTRPAVQQHGGPATAITQYQYVDKLPRSQARKLRKQLEKEIKRLNAEKRELTKPLTEAIRRLANDEYHMEHLLDRFERYEDSPQFYRIDPYMVTAEAAPLFTGTTRRGFLPNGTVVLAQRQTANHGWLEVQHRGGRYMSAAEFYIGYASWRKNQLEDEAVRQHKIGQVALEAERLDRRAQTLELVKHQLDYDSRLEGQYMPLADLTAIRFGPITLYEVQRPLGAIEVVQHSRAKRILKQWRKDGDTLRKELRKKNKKLDKLEHMQLTAEHRNARIEERFDAFLEALGRLQMDRSDAAD